MATDSHFHQLILNNERETADLARCVSNVLRVGDMIALAGVLGTGKSTFARALIQSFLPKEEVPSPTFTLVQTYDGPAFRITHSDLYRIKSRSELRELGLDEALEEGVLVVEWPDRMSEQLPADRLDIIIEVDDGVEERRTKLIGRGNWARRIRELEETEWRS